MVWSCVSNAWKENEERGVRVPGECSGAGQRGKEGGGWVCVVHQDVHLDSCKVEHLAVLAEHALEGVAAVLVVPGNVYKRVTPYSPHHTPPQPTAHSPQPQPTATATATAHNNNRSPQHTQEHSKLMRGRASDERVHDKGGRRNVVQW